MSKMITQNRTLNFFSEIKKHIGACCFLLMLVMMSGTAWAQIPGAVCEGPINISGLPYVTTDNTSAYGNDYSSSDRPPLAPGNIGNPSSSYLGGDDVVYAYTPLSNENLNVTVSNHDSWVGFFIFTGCPFSSTVGGQTTSSSSTTLSVANFPAAAGVTYYFVISTWPTPNNTPYTLNIESVPFDCLELGVNFGAPCTLQNGGAGEIDENCECAEVICQNTSKYPSNAVLPNATGEVTTISTCNYWSEYSEIGGVVSGFEYEFNSVMAGANAFVTVRSGSVGGAIVASGFGPLTITAPSSDNLFVHWNLDAICGTQSGCAVSTVSCVSCASAADCEGVIGGPAQPGSSCDDGNPETYNDVYQDDCSCAGALPAAGSFCDSAIAIECGADAQTFSSAEAAGTNTTSCFMGAKGLWFSFEGTGSEIIVNSTASFDHRLSVNSGSCGNLTNIVCQDGSVGAENYTIASSVAGLIYYVYIAHYSTSSSATGNITISLECATPPECTSPEVILSAIDGAQQPVEGCLEAGSTYLLVVSLQGGEGNDFYQVIAAGDTAIVAAGGSAVFGAINVGTNSSVKVTGVQDNACVVNSTFTSPAVCAPSNDDCASAIAIACGQPLNGTTIGATQSTMSSPSCAGGTTADVFYTLDIIAGQEYTVTVVGANYDGVLSLYSGVCGQLVEEACADNGFSAGVAETITFTADEAGTIYIRTYDWSSDRGSFVISVECADVSYDCEDIQANYGDACVDVDGNNGIVSEDCGCVIPEAVACTNSSSYGSANVSTPGTKTVSTCQFFGEYSPISGVNAGYEYVFTGAENTSGNLAYITVRSGSYDGPVIGSGLSPLTITATSSDNLYIHWNSNTDCGSASNCATTTATCITCASIEDCAGVAGGSALPGTSCNDGDATTVNDLYDADCNCAGEPATEASICATAIPVVCNSAPATYSSAESNGVNTTACSMGDKGLWFSFMGTGADITINSSASFDHRLSVNSGPCDDLSNLICKDSSTGAENYTISSSVPGESYYVYIARYNSGSTTTGDITISLVCAATFDCPQLEANIGDACDDGDEMTENDVIDANCGCAGTPIIVFDCPQIGANIGDGCDDGDDMTENDAIDANCGCAGTPIQQFDCPQLEANFGDACNDGDPNTGNDVIIGDCSCAGTPIETPTCEDFVYYISDHDAADGISDIYSVTLSGGVATMEYIATSDIEIHIAYNEVDNLIYAVSKHTNSYRTINPHVVAPSFGPTIALGADYGELTAAAFNADGKLVIGSQNNNAIYSVNVTSNLVSPYDAYSPVTGGDLAFGVDGMLYLATRSGNGLYENYPSPAGDVLIGSVTSKVTGLAITNSNQLLVSNQGNSSLEVRNLDGTNPGTTYVLTLDGEPFTLRDGDMASGCNSYNEPGGEECGNYKLYYIHSPQGGGQQPLLEVTLNGDGTASYSTVLANLGGHIGISPDGSIIYNVNGNKLKVVDVNAASIVATMNIVTSGGASLSGFPAATVAADGTLYVGHTGTNQVYSLDPIAGVATPYGPSRSVNGGDLIDVNGEIWLITRNNNKFTNVMTGVSFTVPVTEINGAAVLGNGNVLLSDGNGGSLLKEVELASQTVVATYDISLPLFNGDLAGVCAPGGGLTTECYGFEILDFVQGLQTNGTAVPANRSDANAALGEPDRSNAVGGFVSLGVGGYITIGFGGVIYDAPGNDIKIWETSFSGDVCGSSDDESADIAVSQDGVNFVSVGTICRDGEVDIAGTGLDYVSAIRITNSASTASLDGYDVDGVEAINGCSDEPIIEEGDCYATEVVEYIQGTSSNGGAIATNRTDASKALGAPERVDQLVFVSLGYGGSITLAFDGAIPNGPGDDIEIVETTYGNSSCATYPEYADVYVSVDGINFTFAKTVCRADGFVDISEAGPFAYVNFVKIVNNNDLSTTPDAFDVDGVVALYNCEDGLVTPGFRPVTESELSSFPNPTAGQSQVVFVTAETGRTLVEVYDMSGRNIATLFNAEAQNGKEYRLDFDGAALPNGVYIYKMTTNNESIIEKFMIAK